MSYSEQLLGESYSSAEMQSVYSTTQTDWANGRLMLSTDFVNMKAVQKTGAKQLTL